MTQAEIIAKVRHIMNEAGEEISLVLLSEDTVKLDEYIKSCIGDAVNIVAQNSPFRCVNKKVSTISATGSDGRGIINLPDDFVSLVALRLSGWKRIVTYAGSLNSEEYKVQCNEYARNGLNRPVCFLSYVGPNRVIEYFSKGISTHSVELFAYEARYNGNEGLSLSESDPISAAVCYMCASLVYLIFENKQAAENMQSVALNLIPKS